MPSVLEFSIEIIDSTEPVLSQSKPKFFLG